MAISFEWSLLQMIEKFMGLDLPFINPWTSLFFFCIIQSGEWHRGHDHCRVQLDYGGV